MFKQSAAFLATVTGVLIFGMVCFLGGYETGYNEGFQWMQNKLLPPLSTPFRATMVERYSDTNDG